MASAGGTPSTRTTWARPGPGGAGAPSGSPGPAGTSCSAGRPTPRATCSRSSRSGTWAATRTTPSSACRAASYGGDTPTERRWQVRKWANLILTNPDMLHVGVLPHHDRWADVLHNLAYVVVDEAHVYRGVFGSHVANVLRRLRRLAQVYGAEPQFLLASATIANPGELAHSLLGLDVTVVGDDGAPRPERTVALWNPPLLDEELGLRGSALAEAAKLQAELVREGLRTLVFAKSRKAAELIHKFTAERLGDDSRLSPYRAGYTP